MASEWDDYDYRLVENRPVTPVIRELLLVPEDRPLPFEAGQYVLLCDRDRVVPQRSYSVANAPRADGRVSLLVTLVPHGPTSGWVHHELRTGDLVTLSGPYGTFVADPRADGPVLLLGAGSGLAPVRALAGALRERQPRRETTLIFSARTRADLIDADAAGVRYLHTLTRDPDAPEHRHVPDLLADVVGDLTGWEVFASGPSGFVTGCAAAVQALGAAASAVHTEEFFADPQPWSGAPPAADRTGIRR